MDISEDDLSVGFCSIDKGLEDLVKAVRPLMEKSLEDVSASAGTIESVRLQLCLALAMNTTLYAYMRFQGLAPTDHPIHRQMALLQAYYEKVSSLEESTSEAADFIRTVGITFRFGSLFKNDKS